MNKVGSYGTYVNNYQSYGASAQSGTYKVATEKANETAKSVELSREAKDLLKELQQKYGDMDIIVGDYETEEEAQAYLVRGTKEYSVLITAEELEEMAKDNTVKNDAMEKIESSRDQLASLRTQLEDAGENVKKLSVVFEKDGTSTLFASLEKMSEQQKERLEAKKAEKAEKNSNTANNTDSLYNRTKQTTVTAKTTEELLEKIRNVDWDSVEEKAVPKTGSKFDYFG